MTSHADTGARLLAAKNYPLAIDAYTLALKTSLSPIWLIQRSTAYQRTKNHAASLLDAEAAIVQARERGKRDLIGKAQLRRAIALFGLGRTGDARMVLTWVRKLNEKEKGLGMWIETVRKAYEALGEGDEGRKVTVEETPSQHVFEQVKAQLNGEEAPVPKGDIPQPTTPEKSTPETKEAEAPKPQPVQAKPAPATASAPVTAPAATPSAKKTSVTRPAIQPTPADKIRTEWYQSTASVSISILAKAIPKDAASVCVTANKVTVSFPTPTEPYSFTLDPTYGPVDAEKSEWKITPHKLELNLKKEGGLKWSKLEGGAAASALPAAVPQAADLPASGPSQDRAPGYPTSSKHGVKDWDLLAKEELAKARAESAASAAAKNVGVGGKEEQLGDEDDDESDPLHGFFKKIYKGADEDTKRAMMKSFTESGGTALSTDWGKVKEGKVETKAPEGYEEKKF